MKLRDALDAISTDGRPTHVYGQPYETADGATIITVAKVRGKVRPAKADSLGGSEEEIAVRATPLGMFVIHGGQSKWEPAIDATAIAFVGVLTGLVAATLATLAMVRRPPWPDMWGDISYKERPAARRSRSL